MGYYPEKNPKIHVAEGIEDIGFQGMLKKEHVKIKKLKICD